MKRQRRTLFLFLCGAVLIWFLADTERTRNAASDALHLCASSVIPALFPFLAVTGLMMSLGFGAWASPFLSPLMTGLFRLPGTAGSALLLGFLGGYPVGARTAAELRRLGQLTRDESERLLTFCNNANPAFLISVLGVGVFDSIRVGVWLLLIHVASAILTGLLFRNRTAPRPSEIPTPSAPPTAFFPAFVQSVTDAAFAMLRVCAFVVFFSVLIRPLKSWNHPAAAPLVGALELFSLTPMLSRDASGFILASVCAGWGGVSALCQTAAVLDGSGLSIRPCLAGKAVQATISGLLAAFVTRIL